MPKTINSNQLTPDATYLVRGKVGFSRISRHTTDEEREKQNQKRTHPVDKNYTTITVYDAQVICRDTANPTLEERYGAESCYKSSSKDYPNLNFTGMNKSRNLPRVGVLEPLPGNSNNYKEVVLSGELAKGLDVTLVMRVFKGQGSNNGVSLDRVLVNEPIRYYEASNEAIDKSLASFGITFQAMAPQTEQERPAEDIPNEQAAPNAPSMNNAFSAAPAAPQGQQTGTTATASDVPPTAPEANNSAGDSPFGSNPFGSYAGNANQGFGPGARRY